MTTIKTYDQAVSELIRVITDQLDIDDIPELIENGCKGIRQCTNAELIEHWAERFEGEKLEIMDPKSNPAELV